jgi:hypothetical protein
MQAKYSQNYEYSAQFVKALVTYLSLQTILPLVRS